jgi:hypothetical protein
MRYAVALLAAIVLLVPIAASAQGTADEATPEALAKGRAVAIAPFQCRVKRRPATARPSLRER